MVILKPTCVLEVRPSRAFLEADSGYASRSCEEMGLMEESSGAADPGAKDEDQTSMTRNCIRLRRGHSEASLHGRRTPP